MGVSLAKGPVALVGLALLAYGITAFIFGGHSFKASPLSGTVNGKTWMGLEVNAWTSLLFAGSGLLLLFGAPLHWGAKGLALVVGLVLGACAIIAAYDKTDVFGIFAANGLTKLVWTIAAVVLVILALLPRVGGNKDRDDDSRRRSRREPRDIEPARATLPERDTSWDDRERSGSRVAAPASGTTPESRNTTRRQRGDDR